MSNFPNLFAHVRAAVSHLDFAPKPHGVTIAHIHFSAPDSTAGDACLAAVGSSNILPVATYERISSDLRHTWSVAWSTEGCWSSQ